MNLAIIEYGPILNGGEVEGIQTWMVPTAHAAPKHVVKPCGHGPGSGCQFSHREVTAERLEGADHGFRTDQMPMGAPDGFVAVFGRVLKWFLD